MIIKNGERSMVRYFFPAILLIFSAVSCQADVLENFDITARMQKKYSEVTSFLANITQVLTHAESQTSEHRAGKLAFKKPGFINIETSTTDDSQTRDTSQIIVTDKLVWLYAPEEHVAYKYSRDMLQDVSPSLLVLTGQANLLETFSIEDQETEGDLTRLTLYPNEPTTQIVKARIWIETETGILKRVQITDFYENINDITFAELTFNQNLNNSLFQFTPPKGVFVEDHTKK